MLRVGSQTHLQIRGRDQVPVLTRWWRELLPAVVVEVPVKEVAEFLQQQQQQQHVEPKDQKALEQ